MNNDTELDTLQQEVMAQLENGGLRLLDGLNYGTGSDAVKQFDVTFRELTAGDLIEAQVAAEKVVNTPQGPQLVTSPTLVGVEVLRRSIATVGCINGPLPQSMLKGLSQRDFDRLSAAIEVKDLATAAGMAAERGRVVAVSE